MTAANLRRIGICLAGLLGAGAVVAAEPVFGQLDLILFVRSIVTVRTKR